MEWRLGGLHKFKAYFNLPIILREADDDSSLDEFEKTTLYEPALSLLADEMSNEAVLPSKLVLSLITVEFLKFKNIKIYNLS